MMSSIFHFVWMVPRLVDILDLKKRRVFTMGGGTLLTISSLMRLNRALSAIQGGGIFTTSSSEGGIICSYELGVCKRDAPQE